MDFIVIGILAGIGVVAGGAFLVKKGKEEEIRQSVVEDIEKIISEDSVDKIKERIESLRERINGSSSFTASVKAHLNEIWLATRMLEKKEVSKLKEELAELKRKILNS